MVGILYDSVNLIIYKRPNKTPAPFLGDRSLGAEMKHNGKETRRNCPNAEILQQSFYHFKSSSERTQGLDHKSPWRLPCKNYSTFYKYVLLKMIKYDEKCLYEWEIGVFGPPKTIYEGGFFPLIIVLPPQSPWSLFRFQRFPKDYPYRPPHVRFTSPMFHPNVYADGAVRSSLFFNIIIFRCAYLSFIAP